jgi:hypothetical protein
LPAAARSPCASAAPNRKKNRGTQEGNNEEEDEEGEDKEEEGEGEGAEPEQPVGATGDRENKAARDGVRCCRCC